MIRKTVRTLAAASFGLAALCTASGAAAADYIETLELGLTAGRRVDQLDWNIAGNLAGADPNILSELTWDDLEIYQINAAGKLVMGSPYVEYFSIIRGSAGYGWITDGQGRDSDYNGDNRTREFSRSAFSTSDDNVLDLSIGAGFQWKYWQNRFSLTLLGGYSRHEQNLRMTEATQLIPDTGPFNQKLNSTYKARWQGAWAGSDLELRPSPRLLLLGTFEYHWADYKARARWNLRDDFAQPLSFRHDAGDANGIILSATTRYLLAGNWAFDIVYNYQEWEAKNGRDRVFLADGSIADIRLNEVNWSSWAVTAGFTYRWF